MTLVERINEDIKTAMKAKDAVRLDALRMVKAAMQLVAIEQKRDLPDEEVHKVLIKLAKQRRESADQYRTHGRSDAADKELAELALIESYLPPTASADEIRAAVESALKQTGASSIKEMGAVMKVVQAALAGKTVDGKLASQLVKERLAS